MTIAARSGLFLIISLLPFLVIAADKVPLPKPAPSSRPSPCDIAKQQALGKDFNSQTVQGDKKTATTISCVGAVFDSKKKGARRDDINSYKCTGEQARVNFSKSGVLIEARADARVPQDLCATTICEEGKPCRPAKLTRGIKPSDLGASGVSADLDALRPSRIQELQKEYEEAQKVLNTVPTRGTQMSPLGAVFEDPNDQMRFEAEVSRDRAIAEIEKLLGDPLPSGETPFTPEAKDAFISTERLRALSEQDWSHLKTETPDYLEPSPQVRNDLNNITYDAVARAYPTADIQRLQDGEVSLVRQIASEPNGHTFTSLDQNAQKIFHDLNTGERFMEVNPTTGDVALFNNGQAVPIRDEFGNLSRDAVAHVLDTPAKFNTFWNEYLGFRADVPPLAYKAIENPDGAILHVAADSGAALEKTLSYPDYAMLQDVGCDVLGTCAAMERINAWTSGKYKLVSPAALAAPGAVPWVSSPEWPLFNATPSSPQEQAWAARIWEKIVTTFPPSLYENLDMAPATIYTFKLTPEAAASRFYGFGDSNTGAVWMDANLLSRNEPWFTRMSYHELGHGFDRVFPDQTEWAKSVYGDNYGRAYAGTHGAQVFSNVTEFPVGFARGYGYMGGIYEDKATVFESMFTNYSAMQEAAKSDLTLATKMQMIQDSFYGASNGVMDQAWWDRQVPIDRNFVVPRGNLVTRLIQGLQSRAATLRLQK
ncbi:MAG TPA: hypothetical protein VJK53_00015 [Candidatus Paceibacterota bacterium]